MFEELEEIFTRPGPFSAYTAKELWTDPHTSERMLAFHLKGDVDVSSRNFAFIDRSAAWIEKRFGLSKGKRAADFGCGPGLYARRLAKTGAQVTGIDFSRRSLDYAENQARKEGLPIRYVHADYLEWETRDRFDLIQMIMCDFCALSPAQRASLLEKFARLLAPGGRVLLDVYSLAAFDAREEGSSCEKNLLGGFWSKEPYYGFLNVFKYGEEKAVLDKYTLVEPGRTRVVCNWLHPEK